MLVFCADSSLCLLQTGGGESFIPCNFASLWSSLNKTIVWCILFPVVAIQYNFAFFLWFEEMLSSMICILEIADHVCDCVTVYLVDY